MERLRATAAVARPYSDAHQLLTAFFNAHLRDGAIPMRLDIPVTVSAALGRDEENLNNVWHITWAASAGGPFPRFAGTLAVCEDDRGKTYLELDGNYEPPLGVVFGSAFEATVGHRIAQHTAREFVEQIAAGMMALRAVPN